LPVAGAYRCALPEPYQGVQLDVSVRLRRAQRQHCQSRQERRPEAKDVSPPAWLSQAFQENARADSAHHNGVRKGWRRWGESGTVYVLRRVRTHGDRSSGQQAPPTWLSLVTPSEEKAIHRIGCLSSPACREEAGEGAIFQLLR